MRTCKGSGCDIGEGLSVPCHALFAGLAGLLGLTSAFPAAGAKEESEFLDRTVIVAGEQHRYKVFAPADHDAGRRRPIILFLHGSGERGTDNLAQIRVGLGPALQRNPACFPAIIVLPQVPPDARWTGPAAAVALAALSEAEREFHTDPDRVYLTGMSMGGTGAWLIAYRHPDRFAALLIVCARLLRTDGSAEPIVDSEHGSIHAALAKRLRDVPIWLFHGDEDDVVPVEQSRRMSKALRTAGSSARYTELAGVGHDAWDAAYDSHEVTEWLFAQRRARVDPRQPRRN